MKGVYFPDCYGLLSGGKDSMTACDVLAENGKLLGCVALKTGISTPDWEDFVRQTCANKGWPLEIYETPVKYDEYIEKHGFPGPGRHGWIMNRLKGRGIQQFKKMHKGCALASGVRRNESKRRVGNTQPFGVWEGVPIFCPIYDWTDDEVWAYFNYKGFERAPAYSTLQISGDCLCGAFARKDELEAIRFHYPELGQRLDSLGDRIKDRHPTKCKWGWGADLINLPGAGYVKTSKQRLICVECGDTQSDLFEEAV